MEVVKYKSEKLAAVSLNVVWVEQQQFCLENLLRIGHVPLVLHDILDLSVWVEVTTKFHEFSEEVFAFNDVGVVGLTRTD